VAVAKLDLFIQNILNQTKIPSLAIAVVYNNSVVYSAGFGVREVGTNLNVTAETVFQLASLSKPIASTIVSALISDGVTTWDALTNELDPIVQLSDP
jgi:CubicO group peptidase (beta-lactamase class C family)